jgi:hypothetical protein
MFPRGPCPREKGPVVYPKRVADGFVQALCKPDEDVETLVAIHTDDCEVSNVSRPGAFRGHEGLHRA